ncbi:tellurium resistance protein (macronuclear) [Tetrahymena thermophila SB210]|uniref:Tellurium resistance protein n=1 Tax=Tetrahymena thermophila (strain SB210) TaxID=312017 RepID=I7M194_TETTS|nr:tellurium resistance protein [Tetrahymena thermophila SB210]EAR95746.2 tellurium resistance protein [Tetrahymena thermophila SB210]|eukprot:XP_001015991.2 tellurium resistance protein [Tetrahymena thermophila SB210]
MENNHNKQSQVLKLKSYEVRLQWSCHDSQDQQDIDLDLQCLILDDLSQIEDVVYYNQKSSTLADIKLSEDQRGTTEEKQNEMLKINLSDCQYGIKYLAILVCSHDGITLSKLKTGVLEVLENNKPILTSSICGEEQIVSYLPCIFSKQYDGTWILNKTKAVDKVGKTFIECESIVKQGLLSCGFDEGLFQEAKNWCGNKTFDLKKDDVLVIPNTIMNNEVFVGLGWDTRCDIDSSIVTFDQQGNMIENIYFGKLKSDNQSIIHHGDNLTGVGDGDDEVITINLKQVDQRVDTIWSVITIYSQGKNFSDVSGTFCRLVDKKTNKEFCRYNLSDKSSSYSTHNGCIMACIKRYKNNVWAIQPKGFLTQGKRYSSEVAPIIKNILSGNLSQIVIMNEEEKQLKPQQQQEQKQIISQSQQLQQSQLYKQNESSNKIFLVSQMSFQAQNQKNMNPYINVSLNQKQVLKTIVKQNEANPNWSEKIQLTLKEGDIIDFKIYSYNTFCFDTFLGQSKIRISKDILDKNNEESYENQLMDSHQNLNYQSQIKFKLQSIPQKS